MERGKRFTLPLPGLSEAFAEINLARLINNLRNPDAHELPDLSAAQSLQRGSKAAGRAIEALLVCGSRLAATGNFRGAVGALDFARDLGCQDPLISERIGLLRAAPNRKNIAWDISLQDLQRQFGVYCRKNGCECHSHYALAKCLKVFEGDWNPEFDAWGTPAFIVGLYHSWSLSTTWSRVIRRIKLDYEVELLPFASRVAADFMCERTGLAETADILVPVPPSPGKYGERGFAPTDLMAAEISRILAIPIRMVLGRTPGVSTREATYPELFAQFHLDESRSHDLRNRSVVLIEDVVTTGRTISVCVQKLKAMHPLSVNVVALANGTRP